MPKKPHVKNSIEKSRNIYVTQPWQCRHNKETSVLIAYVEASGTWDTIATVNTTAGVSAEAMAQFICDLINDNQKNKDLLREAMKALESVLSEGLTYSTEQDADEVVDSIKKRIL